MMMLELIPSWLSFNLAVIVVALLYGVVTSLMLANRVRSKFVRFVFIFVASCWILLSPINIVNELDYQTYRLEEIEKFQHYGQLEIDLKQSRSQVQTLNQQLSQLQQEQPQQDAPMSPQSEQEIAFESGEEWKLLDTGVYASVFGDLSESFNDEGSYQQTIQRYTRNENTHSAGEIIKSVQSVDWSESSHQASISDDNLSDDNLLDESHKMGGGENAELSLNELEIMENLNREKLERDALLEERLKGIHSNLSNLQVDLRSVKALIVQETQGVRDRVVDTFKSSQSDFDKTTVGIATQMDQVSENVDGLQQGLRVISKDLTLQIENIKSNDQHLAKIWLEYTECLRRLNFWDYLMFKQKQCDDQHELNLSKL